MPPIEPPATLEKLLDAEMVDQPLLGVDHVADGDDGKVEPIGAPVFGLIEAGPVEPMQPPRYWGR